MASGAHTYLSMQCRASFVFFFEKVTLLGHPSHDEAVYENVTSALPFVEPSNGHDVRSGPCKTRKRGLVFLGPAVKPVIATSGPLLEVNSFLRDRPRLHLAEKRI